MKRIIALLLIFIISVCSLGFYTFAEESEGGINDINALAALDIMQSADESTELSRAVSRGEFSSYIAKLLNLNNDEKTAKVYFSDVDKENVYFSYISSLYELGLISRGDDARFEPDRAITYNEAYKIIVELCDYGKIAEYNGGYPTGYISTAERYGLLSTSVGDAAVTYCDAARIIYNAAVEPLCIQSSYGVNNVYEKSEDTLLSIYKNAYLYKGTVTAVYGVSISDDVSVDENQIAVDNVKFTLSDEIAEYRDCSYLGTEVSILYTKDKNNTFNAFFIFSREDNNNDVNISADEYISYDSYTFKYWGNNEKIKTAKTAPGAVFIYNGERVESGITALFDNFKRGSITVRKTDGRAYDLVIVNSYETFVVGAYSAATETFSEKNNSANTICLKDYDYIKIYEGSLLKTDSAFNSGDVLSVAKYGKSIEIRLSTFSDKGTINQINNSERTILLGENEYEIDIEYYEKIKDSIKTGDICTVRCDVFGRAVYMDIKSSDEFIIAYLLTAAVSHDAFTDKAKIKIFNEAGEFAEAEFADKVTVDGSKIENGYNILSRFPNYEVVNGSPFVPMQPLRYKLDKDGKIKELDTLNQGSETESITLKSSGNGSTKIYCPAFEYFTDENNDQVMANSQAVCMNIPYNKTYDDIKDNPEVYFSIISLSGIDAATQISVDGYVIGDEEYAALVVFPGTTRDRPNGDIIIENVGEGIDSDGNVMRVLDGYDFTGAEIKYLVSDDIELKGITSIEDISEGDVVAVRYFEKNGNKIARIAEMVYDYSTGGTEKSWSGYSSEKAWYFHQSFDQGIVTYAFGYVTDVDDNLVKFGNNPGEISEVYNTTKGKVMVYDSSVDRGKFYEGSVADIKDFSAAGDKCSRVIIRRRQITPIGMLIYK